MSRSAGARWLWLSLASLAVDRATKFAIERTTVYYRHIVIPKIFDLVHYQNQGIAFSVFSESGSRWLAPLLLISSCLVMALLVWLLVSGRAGDNLAQSGVALILGGAAGNALDRLIHGSVTDFIEIHLGSYSWPAFNFADTVISVGAALVLMELLFGDKQQPLKN